MQTERIREAFESDSDLWMVINALNDKAHAWENIADELPKRYSEMAAQLRLQAAQANRIAETLVEIT